MKKLSVVAVLFMAVFAFFAHADERVVCALTMPTDGGAISTAAAFTDGGCSLLSDGGIDTCSDSPTCVWTQARSLALQCDNPVYYNAKPDGNKNYMNQTTVTAASSSDMLIDFDINPDPYRIDLRASGGHVSVKSVSTSANVCRVGTVSRLVP